MCRLTLKVTNHLMDQGWFRRMQDVESQANRSARKYERKAEGIRDRVTVSHEGGW